ncbi:hypothetical protein [Pedobacter sp. ASV12]|uniref:hypothetical protein n=1 Tax=Pedobacter sp. ASV12 TaxID=2795120 RepID=UPI001E613A0D|nr:hypothetical protein [Pedobacter sp. ASV12]
MCIRDSSSVAEVARKIISNRKIKIFHQDVCMNAPMEEMALIRKELKAIGYWLSFYSSPKNDCKIKTGKSIRGILQYNENKVVEGQANLILASGFAGDIDKMDFHNKIKDFSTSMTLSLA